MNEQNFQYLKDNIKYMGFGENLTEALQKNLGEGKQEFTLSNKTEINKKPFEVNLHFRKSDNSDMYFFNRYNASLEKSNGEKVNQTFYLNNGKGITAKEAYNLLEGRSVFKELNTKDGVSYKAWVQLDFDKKDKHDNFEVKQFHENYGYDLKASLAKLPISEMMDTEKSKALISSLQKGNIQYVTMGKEGSISKLFVEANPQYKTVTLYDAQMKRMQKEELLNIQSMAQPGKDLKEEVHKEIKQQSDKSVKQKAPDNQELTQKKSGRKKGMSA